MDPLVQIVIAAIVCGSLLVIVKLIIDATSQAKRLPAPERSDSLELRLASIEHAVEAMAIEIERNGELQRFNARLTHGAEPPESARIARPVTPH